MGTVIYLDVLVILNIYVSYFLFLGTAKMMAYRLSKWRLFFGCITGGVYSLLILFELNAVELVVVKLLMGCSLVLIVFFRRSLIHILKCGLYFFLVNFIYGGLMFALWFFFAPNNMAYRNGIAYFDISALTLVISTVVAYLAITLFCYLLNKRSKPADAVDITVTLSGRQAILRGFVDTGNKLCDIFSGLPVIVCEYEPISAIFPEKLKDYFQNPTGFCFDGLEFSDYRSRIKLIPVSAVGGDSALPAFKPDSLLIGTAERQAIIAVSPAQLFTNGEFQAILNPVLLN